MLLYDAVIFDLDGTLTDSEPGIIACTEYALKKMGRPFPPRDVLRRFLGPPLADSYMRYCGMTEEEAAYATELYRERYLPVGWKENRVYPRIRALLSALKERGVYLAVASGKPAYSSRQILEYFGLLPYLDAISGPTDTDLHADKGELIRRVLPEGRRAVMVGDTAGDIQGARDRGIDSVAAMYGYGEDAEVLTARPTHAVRSPWELCELLCPDMPAPKGCCIVLEGASGTDAPAALEGLLSEFGYSVLRVREPEGGSMRDVILPAVKAGQIVLCDQPAGSPPVYGEGEPDITLHLRIPVSAAQPPEKVTEEAFRALLARLAERGVL